MTKRTGGRILVDQLRIQGCDRIFTVPGESFLAVLDALHDTPEIDVTVCRQEGGVAYMALITVGLSLAACNTVRGAGRDVQSAANCTENVMHQGGC